MSRQEKMLVQLSQMKAFFKNVLVVIENLELIGVDMGNPILSIDAETTKKGIIGILEWIEDMRNYLKEQIDCVTIKPVDISKYH